MSCNCDADHLGDEDDVQSVTKPPQRRLVRFAGWFLLARLRAEEQEGWKKEKKLIDVIFLCEGDA